MKDRFQQSNFIDWWTIVFNDKNLRSLANRFNDFFLRSFNNRFQTYPFTTVDSSFPTIPFDDHWSFVQPTPFTIVESSFRTMLFYFVRSLINTFDGSLFAIVEQSFWVILFYTIVELLVLTITLYKLPTTSVSDRCNIVSKDLFLGSLNALF